MCVSTRGKNGTEAGKRMTKKNKKETLFQWARQVRVEKVENLDGRLVRPTAQSAGRQKAGAHLDGHAKVGAKRYQTTQPGGDIRG